MRAPSSPPARALAFVRAGAERQPLVLVCLGVCLYATGPVLLQSSGVSGPVFSFWRLWIGAAAMGLAALVWRSRTGAWPTRRGWCWAAAAGAAFGVHQLLFFTAIKLTTVADVSLMSALSPLFVGVVALPLFGERPGRGFWGWTAAAIAGAAAIAVAASQAPGGDPVGMLLAALNVVAFGVFFLISKRARTELGVIPFLFAVMVVAALLVSSWALVAGEAVGSAAPRDLWLAAAVALGPGSVGHFVMTWPLRWVPANVPPVLKLAQPVISGLLAWAFVGEALTSRHLLGGAVVLIGAAGAVLSRDGRRLRREAREAGDTLPAGRLETLRT